MENIQYASSSSALGGATMLESLVLYTLPDFGPHGDGVINNNFLLSYLKEGKRYRIVDGGLEAWKGVLKQENTNFGWQAPTADMKADLQDPAARLRWDWKTFTGSLVINKLHEAMNKGSAMIKEWGRGLRDQAESTIPNQFNSGFWAATPGTQQPESIPSLISATPTVGTIGGQTRSASAIYQNGAFTTTVADIGAEAGLSALFRQIARRSIGSGGKDKCDLVITTDQLWCGLSAFLTTLNRYRSDERMAKIGFQAIDYLGTTIGFENTNVEAGYNTILEGYVYGINSKHMFFEALKDGNFIWNPDGFERVGKTLNKALYFWVFCALTTNLPKAHFVMTNVSTT